MTRERRDSGVRLTAVNTHPIQYQVPLWRRLATDPRFDFDVVYASRHGVESRFDPGFGQKFAWDIPLLDGYRSRFSETFSPAGWRPSYAYAFPTGLTRDLSRRRPDALLVHGYTTAASVAALVAARRARVPVIMRGESHLRDPRSPVAGALKRPALRSLLRVVSGYLSIGTLNTEYWVDHGADPSRIAVGRYAVHNEWFREELANAPQQALQKRDGWGAGPASTVFLFVGKFIPVKGVELLLRAYAPLAERHDTHLVLVGAGPLESELRQLAQSLNARNVHWEGFVNQSALPHVYAAADVLVLPSLAEPWGLVVNEAMACGTPCIVSDVAGASVDLVEGKGTGATVTRGSVDSLRDALEQGVDVTTRSRWKAAVPEVIKDFSFEQNADALYELIDRVAR